MAITLDGTAGITTPDLTDTSLTSGRVVYAGTSGNLTGVAGLTFDGATTFLLDASASGSQANFRVQTSTAGAVANGYFNINGTDYFRIYGTSGETGLRNPQNTRMFFSTNNTERMVLPAAGGVQAVTTISVGNATPSASGAGITFPATQSASSDANTLDDYEEGTFTPTLTNDGFTRTYNGTYTAGNYVKVGRTVTVNVVMLVSSQTGTYSSTTPRFNLPFAVYNTATSMRWGTFVCRISSVPNNTPISKICTVQLQSNNLNALDFLYYNASTTSTDNLIDTTGWSGYQIGFTVTYTADA